MTESRKLYMYVNMIAINNKCLQVQSFVGQSQSETYQSYKSKCECLGRIRRLRRDGTSRCRR